MSVAPTSPGGDDLTAAMLTRLSAMLTRHGITHDCLVPGPAHLNLSATDRRRVHLKVARAEGGAAPWGERARTEVETALWARGRGLRVPTPLLAEPVTVPDDAGCTRTVSVWRHLGPAAPPPAAPLQVRALTEAVTQIAAWDPPGPVGVFALAPFTQRILDRLVGDTSPTGAWLRAAVGPVAAAAQDALDASPVGFMHGDLHSENLYWLPEGPVVIDWESACLGPLAWEVAQVVKSVHVDPRLRVLGSNRTVLVEVVLAWARREFGISGEQVEAVAAYRALSSASHLHRHGHRPQHLEGLLGFLGEVGLGAPRTDRDAVAC